MEVRILTFLQLRHNVLITQQPLFMSGKRDLPFILQKHQVFPEEDNILAKNKSYSLFVYLPKPNYGLFKRVSSIQKDFVLDAKGLNNNYY